MRPLHSVAPKEMSKALLMSFSGGRSSALAMRLLTVKGLPENMHIVFANTGKERNETLDFIHECETRWNLPVVWVEGIYKNYDISREFMVSSIGFRVVNYETAKRRDQPDSPFEKMIAWVNSGIVPNRMSRFCTKYLKIVPMQRYMESLGIKGHTPIMGIRHDEPDRIVKHPDAIMPLAQAGITQKHVRDWWSKQDFDLKLKDYEGNCDLCFLKSLRKRKTILKEHPEFYEWWHQQEVITNSQFQQGMPVEKIWQDSQKQFTTARDGFELDMNQPELFGEDMEISCFCGD